MLQSMKSQRVGQECVTEQQQHIYVCFYTCSPEINIKFWIMFRVFAK